MDVLKQENYALLHDESDLEEYDRNNAEKVKSHGKSHLRRLTANMSWAQPQWVCHTIFIAILVLSQVVLCIFVLTEHMGEKPLYNSTMGMNSNIYLIDNGNNMKYENGTEVSDDLKMDELQHENNNKDANILKKVHTLETNIKAIKKIVSSQGENIQILLTQQQAEGIKYEKALERQFNNKSAALNSLQNRLEEGLEIVFSQISQLRDDVYFIENALNQTKQERLGGNEATLKSTKSGTTVSPVTEPHFTASQTSLVLDGKALEENTQSVEVTEKSKTTGQVISKQTDEAREIYHISTSLLKSRADFQVFFYGADKDADGYLTYDEIKNVLGEEVLSKELLQPFGDQSRMYSYTELMKMFSLRD